MNPSDPLASFPEPVRAAYARWTAERDSAALDVIVIAIISRYQPSRQSRELATSLPAEARLVADLGYDSLAVAEVVFFVEDLFGISIGNEDLKRISTVADLRAFVREKIATTPAEK